MCDEKCCCDGTPVAMWDIQVDLDEKTRDRLAELGREWIVKDDQTVISYAANRVLREHLASLKAQDAGSCSEVEEFRPRMVLVSGNRVDMFDNIPDEIMWDEPDCICFDYPVVTVSGGVAKIVGHVVNSADKSVVPKASCCQLSGFSLRYLPHHKVGEEPAAQQPSVVDENLDGRRGT